ncbi:hypothetical protein KKB80_12030, partial [bacterium]|nr:hypothetical protein [bacterium]
MPIRFIDEKEEKAVDKPRVRFLDDKEAAEPGKKVRFLDEEAPVAPLAMSAPSGLAGAIPAPTPYTPPVETRQNLANQLEAPLPVAGPKSDLVRRDGSGLKGKGYLGAQSLKDGRVASELSMGTTDINGAEMDIPTMVPTLTQPELDWLLTHEGERLPESISRKATDHARERLKQGKSVWAQEGEQGGVAPTPAVVPPVPGGLAGAAPEAFVPPAKPERSMLENLKEETRRGDEGVLLDMEAFKAWQGTVPWEEVKKKRDEFKARVEADPVGKDAGFLERAVYGTGAMAPPMLRGIEAGAELGLLSAGGALIAGQIPPLTAMPEEIATVPLAYGAGSAVGQFEYWSRQGTGQIYGDLRDAGVSDKTAKWAAPIGGLPYAAIEFSQVDKIFPGLGRKAKTFAKQSLMKGLLRLAAKLGVNTINEVGEEGVQQVTTDTVTAVGKYIDCQLKKEDVPEELRQIGANAWQAVYQSLGPMGLLQLPGATVGAGRQVTAARGQKQTGEVAANLQVLLDQSGDPAARRTAAEAIYNELLAKDQKAAKAFALTAEKILTSPPIPVNPEAAAQAAQAPAPVVLGPTPEQVLADPAQFEQGREQAAQYLRGEAQAARTAGERAEAVRYRGMANAVANSTPETYPAIFAGIEAEFAQGSLVRRTQTGNERFQQQTATGLLGATAEEIQQADQTIAARENLVKTLAQAAAVRAQAPIKAVQGDAAADDLNYQILQAKANGTPDLTGPATPTQKTVTPSGDLTPEVSPVPDLQQPQPQEVSDAVKTGREPTGDRAKYPGAASRQNIPADQAQDGVEKGAGAERGDRAGGVAEGQVGAGERVLVPAEPAKYRVHKGMVAEEVAKRRAQLDHKIVSARKGLEYIQANTLLQNRSDAQRQLVGAIDKLMQKRDAITPAAVESELYADRVKRVKRASKASIKRYPSEIARAIMPKGLKPNADAVEEFDEHIPAHYRNDKTGAPIDVALDELRTGVEDERGVQVQGGLLRKDAGLKELGAMLRENDRLAGMKQADIEEETPESILNQQGVDEQKWFEHESEVVDQANINDGDTVQVHGRTLTAKETKEGIELSDGTVLPIVDAGDPAGQMRIDLIDGKSSLRRKADLVLEAKKDEIDAEQNRRDAAVEKQAREDAAEEKRVEAAKAKELEKQAQVIPGMPAKKSRLMPVKKSLLGEAPPGGWTLWDKTPEAVRKSADLTTTDGESRVLPGAPEVRYTVRKRDGEIRVSFFRDKPTQLSVYAEGSTVEGAFDAAWTSFAGKARKIQVAKPAAAEGVAQSTAGMSPDLAYQTEYQNYLLGLSKKAPSPPANLEPFVIENLQRAAKQGAQAIESRPVKKSKLPPKVKERAAGPGPATWTPLGDAYAGGQIETDDNGVRSVVKDGIRRTQPVRMIPSKDGVHSGFDSPDLLFKKDSLDYLTKKEVAEFRSQIQFKATDKEDRTETVKAESNTDKQQPWDTKAGDIYDGPDGGNTYVFSKETKLKEARKIVEVLKEQGLQARVNAWLGKRPDGSTQKMPLSHWDVLVDNVSESLSKQLDRLRAVKAGEVKPATEDRPETGKQYSLSEISKGKTWAEAEFTSEKHREDFVAKLINGRATKDGVMYRMRAVKEGEYTYDVQRTSAGEWELNKETWSSRPAAADMAAVEAFGAKREKSKMPPSKTVNAVEVDILKQSGIPKAEVSDYISDTVANGAALRKHAEAVNTGKETVEDAAKAITGDWETKQVESVVKPAEAPRPAVKSPVANLSDADQAKMKALQAAMRKKLLGQVSIGLDPEVLTLSAQMAELYVKGGVKTFNQFAANVKTDMADMWDKVKAYLHSAWQAAGATDNTLDDVNRADAAAAVAELDQEAAPAEEVAPEVPSKLPEPKSQQVADVAPGMQIVEQFHSKRGKNVYIVTMADRVERDAYQRLAAQARMLGGKWSREWKPTHSPAGFMFNRREQAETFVNSNQETPVPAKAKLPPGQSAIAKAFQEGGRGAVLPDRGVKGSGVTTTTPKETDLFSLQSSEEGIDSIVGREARRDSSKQDEGSGTEALAGTPSEDVSADAEGGVVGQTPDRSGGVDTEGVKRPDRQERPGRPGVGDGEGKLPAPAVRRGRAKPGRDAVVQQPTRNFRITDDTVLGAGTPAARISNNLAAIRLAKQLTAEGSLPTPAEQAVLIQYVGWGGLPGMFEKHLGWAWTALQDKETPTAEREGTGTKDPLWSKHKELRELITPEEYDAAEGSTLNAHYTSPDVISGMYSALEHFGFKGGRMLETSAGIGHFIGLQPDFSRKTTWAAVEKDTITGMILKLLYPDASVNVRGYEKTPLPDNFFDVIMSNVPFGSFQVSDPKYDKHKFMIHDYFFAKSLDKVRPGGMVAFITSAGTMDKLNDSMRNYVSKNGGQFIGAIRLPNTAFKGNAGTEVVTDVIFIRKVMPGEKVDNSAWDTISDVSVKDKDGDKVDISVNDYFKKNRDMVLGKLTAQGSMYTANEMTVVGKAEGLGDRIAEAAQKLPADIITDPVKDSSKKLRDAEAQEPIAAPTDLLEGNLTIHNGKVMIKVGENLESVKFPKGSKDASAKVTRMIVMRTAARKVLQTQHKDEAGTVIQDAMDELNKAYDYFVKHHGFVHAKENKDIILEDTADASLIFALETWKEESKTGVKTDIFTKRLIVPKVRPETAANIKDAASISLNETGALDFDRIAELLKMDRVVAEDQALKEGLAFRNPENDTIESRGEYLSGFVRRKLDVAQAAADQDPQFKANTEALVPVQPKWKEHGAIGTKMGSSWVSADTYKEFLADLLDISEGRLQIDHNEHSGAWNIQASRKYGMNAKESSTYGVSQRNNAYWILDRLFNGKAMTIWETASDGSKSINIAQTALAKQRAELIQNEFNKWLWADERRTEMETRFNNIMNGFVPREWDGSGLSLDGMSSVWQAKLAAPDREFQKNGIARGVQGGNMLMAWEVGAGKTIAMAATGMEMRRLGLVRKPLYVVPNHMLEQWAGEFREAYPLAKLLLARPEDLDSKEKRKAFVARTATGDWDGVLIRRSTFKMIGVSRDTELAYINDEMAQLRESYDQARSNQQGGRETRAVKQLRAAMERLQVKIDRLMKAESKDVGLTFEDMGADMLFVDEAHNYKGLMLKTGREPIPGLTHQPSQTA